MKKIGLVLGIVISMLCMSSNAQASSKYVNGTPEFLIGNWKTKPIYASFIHGYSSAHIYIRNGYVRFSYTQSAGTWIKNTKWKKIQNGYLITGSSPAQYGENHRFLFQLTNKNTLKLYINGTSSTVSSPYTNKFYRTTKIKKVNQHELLNYNDLDTTEYVSPNYTQNMYLGKPYSNKLKKVNPSTIFKELAIGKTRNGNKWYRVKLRDNSIGWINTKSTHNSSKNNFIDINNMQFGDKIVYGKTVPNATVSMPDISPMPKTTSDNNGNFKLYISEIVPDYSTYKELDSGVLKLVSTKWGYSDSFSSPKVYFNNGGLI